MHTKNEKLLTITQNPNEFAEKLLQLITIETPQGAKRLLTLIEKAQSLYNKPVKSTLTGWFYGQFRLRGDEIDSAAKGITRISDAHPRLQVFNTLIGKGKWNDNSSFNYFLFVELIKSIPGYKPLASERYPEVIEDLRELLTIHIKNYLKEYQTSLNFSKQLNVELKTTQKQLEPSVDKVFITNEMHQAQTLAINQPDNIIFFLIYNKDKWRLAWVDNLGKDHALSLNKELECLFEHQKIKDIGELNSVHFKRLKNECFKIKDAFLEKTQVLINPKDSSHELSNERLIEKGTTSTFILRSKQNEYQLWWVNSLGKINEIALDEYPQLKEWLSTKNKFSPDQCSQLKAYLLHVNTRNMLGMSDFKKVLSDKLLHLTVPIVSKPTGLHPKRLNISLYSNINDCLSGKKEKECVATDLLEELNQSSSEQPILPGRLKLSEYSTISSLFKNPVKQNEHLSNSSPKI